MIREISNNPAKVPHYSKEELLEIAEALAGNHAATYGEFTAAVIRRLIGMVR